MTQSEFVLWGVVRGHPNAGSTGIVWGFVFVFVFVFSFCLHCLCLCPRLYLFLSVCIVFVIEGTIHSNARSRVIRGGDLYLRDTIVSDCSGHRDGGTHPAVHLVVGHNLC